MKFQKFGYEVKLTKVTEEILKATLDGEHFCTVSNLDGEWVASNELTVRTGATAKEAVQELMEVLV